MTDDPVFYETMPTRGRAEKRARWRRDRRAHGAWRVAVRREAMALVQRVNALSGPVLLRPRLFEQLHAACWRRDHLPLRPHHQTLSAWAAQRPT